jgi:hypothetical protein
MKISALVKLALVACFCSAFSAWCGDDELKPWEKLGISQTEWRMINDNHISEDKVREILTSGIGIGEYIAKPWQSLGLTESNWIDKRRSGLTSYDIELESKPIHRNWKGDSKSTMKSELGAFSKNKDLFLSFAVPGLQQARINEKWRARIMGGLAIGSIAGCVVGTIAEGHFEGIPIFLVLVPDMAWSFLDFKVALGKME